MTRAFTLAALSLAALLTGCTLVTDSSQFLADGGDTDAGDRDAGPDDFDAGPEGFDAGPGGDAGPGMDGGAVLEDGGPPIDGGAGPPAVVFLSGSVAGGGTTNISRAEFTFVANPMTAGSTYECELESVTAGGTSNTGFQSCTSPVVYDLLEAGLHTLSVRAMNPGTGFGTPATRSWTLEAMNTDIRTIQEGVNNATFTLETLVTITARVQRDYPMAGSFPRLVAVADAGSSNTFSTVAWHGIMVRPSDPSEAPLPAGLNVAITGTVRETDTNTEIVGATFNRMTMGSPYTFFNTRDGNEAEREELEGLVITIGGEIPGFNCSSGCNMNPTGSVCLHPCDGCEPVRHRDVSGAGSIYFNEYGAYTGAMRDTAVGPEIWVFEFAEANDICL